jgi:hypothetical protein
MKKLLKKAFDEASKLPDVEQNALAKWLLAELAAERRWDKLFAESEDVLAKLADEAARADDQGKTEPLDLEKL